MKKGTVPVPIQKVRAYAQAIMMHVRTAVQFESWQSFLKNLEMLWLEHHHIVAFWALTPQISIELKKEFLAARFLPKKNDTKERFLKLLIKDNLWDLLALLQQQLQLIYDKRQNKAALEIASFQLVSVEQEDLIKRRFEREFPGKIFYIVHKPLFEPGIIARFGDYLLDLRASSRLRQIKNQLLKG